MYMGVHVSRCMHRSTVYIRVHVSIYRSIYALFRHQTGVSFLQYTEV